MARFAISLVLVVLALFSTTTLATYMEINTGAAPVDESSSSLMIVAGGGDKGGGKGGEKGGGKGGGKGGLN